MSITGILTPTLLILAGIYLGARLRFFWILHPRRTARALFDSASDGGTPPFAALTMALAGTLGVGNIAGVATAITAGGAGAVLWMLLGAVAAMSVKYAEVYLAVRYRRIRTGADGQPEFYGGAMLYIRDGLTRAAKTPLGERAALFLGGGFALLCACNALLTGNLLQVRAAVSCVPLSPLWFGILFAAASWAVTRRGMRQAAAASSIVIPLLTAIYLALSAVLIVANAADVPRVLARIWREAWAIRPAAGGVLGYGMSRAIRYGVTRGIFSNEAGCGTAPTAHASANAKSPYHQGCLGIFEVFADTVLLCSVTALVILLYTGGDGLDGVELALAAYTSLAADVGGVTFGCIANGIMRSSIVLFAFATIVCQSCYGIEALRYFLPARLSGRLYRLLSAAAVIAGAISSPALLWSLADALISLMTCLNVLCLLRLSHEVHGDGGRQALLIN